MAGDISTLKRMLADRAQAVCEALLPAGRIESGEWCAGSIHGEAGKSLKVCLKGQKAGIWGDFADGGAGDLIDLWMACKGLTLVDALDDIRGWLGVEAPSFLRQRREYTRPPKPKSRKPKSDVLLYLTEGRNLPQEAIDAYKVAEDGNKVIFPFLRDGELVLAKVREAVDGANPKPTAADCEPILFGWQAIDDNARHLVITEGEIDAMSMWAYGHPACSVPFGGGGGRKQQWIENEFDRLERFETIYLALDNDEPGQEAVDEIAKRLGRHRCRVVRLPRKDANECLLDGVAKAEIDAAIEAAETMDPEILRNAGDFMDGVKALFHPPGGVEPGYRLPYGVTHGKFLFRPGEVTVWTGASGSGKSQMLSDSCVDWIAQGSRTCMASLEMAPVQTMRRMIKQLGKITATPAPGKVEILVNWLAEGLYLVDRVGKLTVKELLEVFDYARCRYGCDQFVIDSLMRLGLEADDYAGQEQVVYQIVDWAIDADVHLHLVAHSRKAGKDRGVEGIEEIKGAMEVGANAFNVLAVHRRRWLEDKIAEAETDDERAKLEARPGVVLNVAKQRNGDWEGKVGLWFDQGTYQYRSRLCDAEGRFYAVQREGPVVRGKRNRPDAGAGASASPFGSIASG